MSNRTSLFFNLHATEKVQDAYMTRRAAGDLKHLCNRLPDRVEDKQLRRLFLKPILFLFFSRLDGAPFSGLGANSWSFRRQIGGGRSEGQ